MPSLDKLNKLAEAEYRVPEINARVDEQRQIIESLSVDGQDLTSAKIVLDSLLRIVFCASRRRQRLRVADSKDEGAKAA